MAGWVHHDPPLQPECTGAGGIGHHHQERLAEIGINVDLVQVQSADYFNLAFGGAGFPSLFIYKDMAGHRTSTSGPTSG